MADGLENLMRNAAATRCNGDITFHIPFLLDRDPILASLLMRLYDVAQRAEDSPTLDAEDPLVRFGTAAFAQWNLTSHV